MKKKTVILFLTMPREGQEGEDAGNRAAYEIWPVYIEREDWNRRLVPWENEEADWEGAYGKGAEELLRDLLTVTIPKVCETYGLKKEETEFVIAGYSLAGLFGLWSLYRTEAFSAAVCCSGSLWYPHFREFVKSHELKRRCRIYLSLGTKEEKSGSRQMRTVGDATREIFEHLQRESLVEDIVLEWNPGNHFTDVEGRMRKGFAWILGGEGNEVV